MKKSFFVLISIVFIFSFVLVGLVGLNYRNTSRIYTSSIVCNEFYYSSDDSLGQYHVFEDQTEEGENLVVLDYVPGMKVTLSPQAYPLDASILADSKYPYVFYTSSKCATVDEKLGIVSFTEPGTATIRIYPADRTDISTTVLIKAKSSSVIPPPPDGETEWLDLADPSILSLALGQSFDISDLGIVYVNEDVRTPLLPSEYTVTGTVDTSTVGQYPLTVTYGELTRVFTVSVAFPYEIDAFDLPEFVDRYLSNLQVTQEQSKFTNPISYVVGDDNPFIFLPRISAWDKNDKHIYLKSYTSISTVEVQISEDEWMLLEGDLLAAIVNIDETASSYDFTEAAIGNTYRLTVSPASASSFSVSFEFTVVDGWNVYTAVDLSRVDNSGIEWEEYKAEHGVDNTEISAVVFQNSLALVASDLPSGFFHTSDSQTLGKEGWMRDQHDLYRRTFPSGGSFTVYGNSFTLDVSGLPTVPAGDDTAGGYGMDYSNVSLFKFEGNNADKTYSGTASAVVRDLSIIGNACMVTEDAEALEKGLGGVIAIKPASVNMTLDNVIVKMTYVAFFSEYASNVSIQNCRAFDSLQNALFVFGGSTINVQNCIFKYCGGPTVISMFSFPEQPDPQSRAPEVFFDSETIIENPIVGDEVWFVNLGLSSAVTQLKEVSGALVEGCKAINEAFEMLGKDQRVSVKSLTHKNEENVTVMTVLGTLLAQGDGVYGYDLQGSLAFDGKVLTSLDAVDALRAKIAAAYGETAAKEAIILESNGQLFWSDGENLYLDYQDNVKTTFVAYVLGMIIGQADGSALEFFDGDTLTIHLGTVAVVLEMFPVEE